MRIQNSQMLSLLFLVTVPMIFILQHTDEQRKVKNREAWCSGGIAFREGETQVQAFPAQSSCTYPSLPVLRFQHRNSKFS